MQSVNYEQQANKWDQIYASEEWADFPSEPLARAMHDFCPKERGLNLLELGCGIGTQVPLALKYATKYLGVDFSQVAIKRAQDVYSHEARAEFSCCDLTTKKIIGSFDCVLDCKTLCCLSEGDMKRVLRGVKECMRDQAVIFSYFVCDISQISAVPIENPIGAVKRDRYFTTRSIDEMKEALSAFDFEILVGETMTFTRQLRNAKITEGLLVGQKK